MARRASLHPTDVELEILRTLWSSPGAMTLGEVFDNLARQRNVAKTTVATMLGVMLEKKLVRRKDGPSGYAWSAAVNHRAAASGMVGKLLEFVFEGSASRMVSHLIDDGRISGEELEQIAKLRRALPKSKRKTK